MNLVHAGPGVRDGRLQDDLGPLVSLLVLAGSQALHDPLQSSYVQYNQQFH
jgi:hypothetical protein